MDVRVRFRFNKATGEVELFEIDDEGTTRLPLADHDREHDRIAAEVGRVIEHDAQVDEVLPGAAPVTSSRTAPAGEEAQVPERERARGAG